MKLTGTFLRALAAMSLLILSVPAGRADAQEPRTRRAGPARRGLSRIPSELELIQNVEFGRGGDRVLLMDILRPKTRRQLPTPVLVFIHGGGWRGGRRQGGILMSVPFALRGMFCATIDYRLSGEATFPAQIEDCKSAIRFLRAHADEYDIDPDRIAVWGVSAGGHLSALLGTSGDVPQLEGGGGWREYSSRVQAVCSWAGPTDLARLLGVPGEGGRGGGASGVLSQLLGDPEVTRQRIAVLASPVTHVSRDDPPFLILHGGQDRLVPVEQATLLHEALTRAGVPSTLRIIPGAGHGFGGANRDRALTALMIEFLNEHLSAGMRLPNSPRGGTDSRE